jgi:hypothetical protein
MSEATSDPREFRCGPLRVRIEQRSVEGDGGPSLQLFDEAGGGGQVLRFDCFERAPHYHYAPEGKDEIVALDATANGDPFEWALERIRMHLAPMLERAGAARAAAALRADELEALVRALRAARQSDSG